MSLLLNVARLAAVLNVGLLVALGYVWGQSYRRHGASHTLGLLVFALLLLVQNALWLFLYGVHDQFLLWFERGDLSYQSGMTLLCGLETVALLFLARISWR